MPKELIAVAAGQPEACHRSGDLRYDSIDGKIRQQNLVQATR